MKNLLFWCSCLMLSASVLAQAPQAFNYQGIARDGNGTPFANRNITLRIAILQGALPGTEVYQESHNAQTNKLGIFTVEVGHGHSQLGAFEDVDWGSSEHYIQIEMDPEGGTNYKLLGESQLLSVPYALYAGNSSGGESLWRENPEGIHFNEGNVGIGTQNPLQKLAIQGEDNAGEDIDYLFLNNTSLGERSGVLMALSAGDNASQTTIGHHAETYTFDNDKYTDFGQVHSTGAGLILRASSNEGVIKFMMGHNGINSSTERMRITNAGYVGIGTENPTHLLTLDGNVGTGDNRFFISVNNNSLSNRSFSAMKFTAGAGTSMTTFGHNSETYDVDDNVTADFGGIFSSGAGIHLTAGGENGVIKFLTGRNDIGWSFERMRLTSEGNLGIGSEDPKTRLQVADGDIYIEDIVNGVIMKSPDGNCWRLTINDDGSIKTTAITCPQ